MPNFSLSKPKVTRNSRQSSQPHPGTGGGQGGGLSKLKALFKPVLLEEVYSKYSGNLKVYRGYGSVYVTTDGLTQSGGLIRDLWQSTFKKISPHQQRSWLVLGLAMGTVAQLIAKKYHPTAITGVDIDKTMLNLGRKYHNLHAIPNLTIINSDAQVYLKQKLYQKYDYILVDMYLGDQLPAFIYTDAFVSALRTHLTPDGIVVFNHLFYDDVKKKRAEELVYTVQKHFSQVVLHRALTNLLILCSRPLKPV